METINGIPNITTNTPYLPNIQINGTGIRLIRNIRGANLNVRDVRVNHIADTRTWITEPPEALPIEVPVTTLIGTPIVNMPGCVKVHKENTKGNKSKTLVNDDPKQNTVLCDAGMPYYEPPDYDYRELSWQTITTEPEEGDKGVDTGEVPQPNFDTPEPPPTGAETAGDVECPPPNARRIGDRNQKGTEQVKEYKLTPDGKICETIWEPVPPVEQFLPTVGTVTTTAVIATVATTSALFAKPLADLLLKVIKPVVKKVMTKVNSILGRQTRRPSRSEVLADQYRLKKGLLPLKKTLKKK